jgi:hypothetical protein
MELYNEIVNMILIIRSGRVVIYLKTNRKIAEIYFKRVVTPDLPVPNLILDQGRQKFRFFTCKLIFYPTPQPVYQLYNFA